MFDAETFACPECGASMWEKHDIHWYDDGSEPGFSPTGIFQCYCGKQYRMECELIDCTPPGTDINSNSLTTCFPA